MGFGTVFGGIMFLFIFLGMTFFAVLAFKQFSEVSQAQGLSESEGRRQSSLAITVTSAVYGLDAVIPWVDTSVTQFSAGVGVNTSIVSPGTVTMNTSSGFALFTSAVIDTGASNTNYTQLNWSGTLPAESLITFQVRVGATELALQGAPWTGSDGTGSTRYTASTNALNQGATSENRFFQYRAYFESNTTSPQLAEVRIGVQRPGGVTRLTLENTGADYLSLTETDFYLNGIRVERTASARTLDYSGLTDTVLWQPGDSYAAHLIGSLTLPTQYVVANEGARAAGVLS